MQKVFVTRAGWEDDGTDFHSVAVFRTKQEAELWMKAKKRSMPCRYDFVEITEMPVVG